LYKKNKNKKTQVKIGLSPQTREQPINNNNHISKAGKNNSANTTECKSYNEGNQRKQPTESARQLHPPKL